MPDHALAVVGLGIRALGFLTANPRLREHRLVIVDEGWSPPGAGAFSRIFAQSNSSGSDFFNWIDPSGPYASVLALADVRRLRREQGPFDLQLLAAALTAAAAELRRGAPSVWEFRRSRVSDIDVAPGSGVTLGLADGEAVTARLALLATGVTERLAPDIAAHAAEAMTASQLLAQRADGSDVDRMREVDSFCVLGTAHSAFSAVRKLLEMGVGPERVSVVGRSTVRRHYPDLASYEQVVHAPEEAVPAAADLCPLTGQVFRYHGLRHGSRDLFDRIVSGELPVGLHTGLTATEIEGHLRKAELVVQATGYVSNIPRVRMRGQQIWLPPTVRLGSKGQLLGTCGMQLPGVYAMGCDPYPYRGHVDPVTQYADRGAAVLAALDDGGEKR